MEDLTNVEKTIVQDLLNYSTKIKPVTVGDDKCRVGRFAIGSLYCEPTNQKRISYKFREPYYRVDLYETKKISCDIIKDENVSINKAYYAILNKDDEIIICDECTVEGNTVSFVFFGSFKGYYKIKLYMSIGDLIEIARDDLEVI